MSTDTKDTLSKLLVNLALISCMFTLLVITYDSYVHASSYQYKKDVIRGAAIRAINMIEEGDYGGAQYALDVALRQQGLDCRWETIGDPGQKTKGPSRYYVCETTNP